MSNLDQDALKNFVDRLFAVEREFADVKAEFTDSKNDLKNEIKSRVDETGVTVAQVQALVKVRMNETEARETLSESNANMFLYEQVYGFAENTSQLEETGEEDDALG